MTAVAVTGVGAVTPVGLTAAASAAALRAGISRLGPVMSTVVDTPAGGSEPAVGGRAPLEWFDGGPREEEWPGHERFVLTPPPPEHLLVENGGERLVRLAMPAAAESWRRSEHDGTPPRDWGLFVGIGVHEDEPTPGRLVEAITSTLADFRPAVVEVIPGGRAAGLAAFARAAAAISTGRIAGAFVGAVDSMVRPSEYKRLADAGQLKDRETNPQGIVPGEAAAFLVLEAQAQSATRPVWLLGAGVANEPTAGTDRPNRGEGLTAAVRAARQSAAPSYMPLAICDLNGDRYRALEWSFVQNRALGDLTWRTDLPTSGDVWHPADCMGDTGAASGAVNCVWAVEAMRKSYALTDRVLIWGASDEPLRAALFLASPS